ncbi:MAG TPA: porin [Lysobacter sp.]|nr:porin [Lysobacter sp.]
MKKQIALALALAIAPFAASAGELSYSYIEGGYAGVSLDGDGSGDADFDGFQLRGSVLVAESIYLFAGYGSVTNDDFGTDIDFNEQQVGAGYRYGLSERADFIAELGYVNQEVEFAFGSVDASGGRVSAGFRGLFSDHFEGLVKASYTDGGDFDGEFSVTAGAQVKFNPTWGVVGEIEAGEDVTKYLIGVRASF